MESFLWVFEVVFGITVVIGLQCALRKFFIFIRSKKATHLHDWRHQIDRIVQPPLTLMLWVFGAVYVLDVLGEQFGLKTVFISYLFALRKAVFIASFGWLFFRWKNEVQKSLLADHARKHDATTIEIIGRLSTIGIVILAGLIMLQTLGVNTAPLLAFGSIGAASIGFAGKDVMANFCSGMMLHITRPFVVGDYIFLPEKHLEGHIEEIGWFRTALRDKEKRPVYLPNNFFSTMLVINISRMSHRRILQTIQVEFEDAAKIPELTAKIREEILSHPTIDSALPMHVHFLAFGPHGCDIGIDAYSTETDQGKFYLIQEELLLKIQKTLMEREIKIAIPKSLLIERSLSVRN
jgi:MscS family membrane protein